MVDLVTLPATVSTTANLITVTTRKTETTLGAAVTGMGDGIGTAGGYIRIPILNDFLSMVICPCLLVLGIRVRVYGVRLLEMVKDIVILAATIFTLVLFGTTTFMAVIIIGAHFEAFLLNISFATGPLNTTE